MYSRLYNLWCKKNWTLVVRNIVHRDFINKRAWRKTGILDIPCLKLVSLPRVSWYWVVTTAKKFSSIQPMFNLHRFLWLIDDFSDRFGQIFWYLEMLVSCRACEWAIEDFQSKINSIYKWFFTEKALGTDTFRACTTQFPFVHPRQFLSYIYQNHLMSPAIRHY